MKKYKVQLKIDGGGGKKPRLSHSNFLASFPAERGLL